VSKSKNTSFRTFLVIAGGLFLLYVTIGSHNNLVSWIKARAEIARIEKQKKTLLEEIEQIDGNIRMLTSDRDTLEKIAREKLNFAAPGEDVYIITR